MDRELELEEENIRLRVHVMELEKRIEEMEADIVCLSRCADNLRKELDKKDTESDELKAALEDIKFERDELAENFQVPFPSSLTELMELEELTARF